MKQGDYTNPGGHELVLDNMQHIWEAMLQHPKAMYETYGYCILSGCTVIGTPTSTSITTAAGWVLMADSIYYHPGGTFSKQASHNWGFEVYLEASPIDPQTYLSGQQYVVDTEAKVRLIGQSGVPTWPFTGAPSIFNRIAERLDDIEVSTTPIYNTGWGVFDNKPVKVRRDALGNVWLEGSAWNFGSGSQAPAGVLFNLGVADRPPVDKLFVVPSWTGNNLTFQIKVETNGNVSIVNYSTSVIYRVPLDSLNWRV